MMDDAPVQPRSSLDLILFPIVGFAALPRVPSVWPNEYPGRRWPPVETRLQSLSWLARPMGPIHQFQPLRR
ncbi:hypothetical protein ASPVEDRAFT_47810 [Aspergillus versicolor CBS 583.65]|uniref:Uncharacterized protein n=1 Tax=Aspergillus versicolor CBS 583.65 TaxID=1036611 RepID=A0A1L9Q4K9_ASPVE|nr:uncharacterized protein ASPVEDRAFT_47810 [Aspergillus versicolor CBS 583.65]OJJ08662.1 hypothetical protein ASPVEDRAFT_47810 [Aspergillus versicolor CBS 583.65]